MMMPAEKGRKTLTVRAHCKEGVLTEITNGRHVWHIDEPLAFGGQDSAPSPVDMFLGALAGGIVAVGILIAAEMGLRLTPIDIQIEGQIDSKRFFGLAESERAGFQTIRLCVSVPPLWSRAERQEWLKELTLRCPMIDNLLCPTKMELVFACEAD